MVDDIIAPCEFEHLKLLKPTCAKRRSMQIHSLLTCWEETFTWHWWHMAWEDIKGYLCICAGVGYRAAWSWSSRLDQENITYKSTHLPPLDNVSIFCNISWPILQVTSQLWRPSFAILHLEERLAVTIILGWQQPLMFIGMFTICIGWGGWVDELNSCPLLVVCFHLFMKFCASHQMVLSQLLSITHHRLHHIKSLILPVDCVAISIGVFFACSSAPPQLNVM